MKLHILSDTHGQTVTPHPDADLIVHAGDFGNARRGSVSGCLRRRGQALRVRAGQPRFLRRTPRRTAARTHRRQCPAAHRKPPLGIWRLHLRWRHAVEQFQAALRWQKTVSRKPRPGPPQHRRFFYIAAGKAPHERRAEPEDYIERFDAQLNFIEHFRHRARTIVLTHFPPHPACTAPQYADSPLNPYFINQIDVAGFDCWIAGHTHQAVDTVQDGCRLIINSLGYPNEYGANSYRDGLLLELPD